MSEKKIIAFCCENSSYKAADSVVEPDILNNVEIVKLPCSGKIEIGLILACFEQEHPGVLVLGCPEDNCTYIRGNVRAKKRVDAVKQALKDVGIHEDLVHMDYLSSVDSHKFIHIVRTMQERIALISGGNTRDNRNTETV